jgi:LDH2 family malate/lactate/ureidoglycolate dehydrogenase
MDTTHRFSPFALKEFVARIIGAMRADRDVALEVARHLVRANLSGHDSHGVIRLPKYVAQVDRGELIPEARPTLAHETQGTGLIDGHRGFGHFATAFGLDWALAKAAQQGMAAAAIRHCTHIGRVGEYTERAAEHGFICIMTVGAAGSGIGGVALYGSRRRFFGANPWSIAVPAKGRPPVVFDGSTSMIAQGKVWVAQDKGVELPPGCIVDQDGRPTTHPEDFFAGGALLPLGGDVAGHKGYGLCLLSALLGGLSMIDDPNPTLIGAPTLPDVDLSGCMAGVFFVVMNPSCFGDGEHYQEMVSRTVGAIKKIQPVSGLDKILLPGELEVRTRERRGRDGVTVPESTRQALAGVGERFGVPLPSPLSGSVRPVD